MPHTLEGRREEVCEDFCEFLGHGWCVVTRHLANHIMELIIAKENYCIVDVVIAFIN